MPEAARGGILREGLGYDRNDVAVVTNIQADHFGLRGIETLQELAAVKGVLVEAVPDGLAVLNADDPWSATCAVGRGFPVVWISTVATRDREPRHHRRPLPPRGNAVVLDPSIGRHDRGPAGPPLDAAGLDPLAAGDTGWPGR